MKLFQLIVDNESTKVYHKCVENKSTRKEDEMTNTLKFKSLLISKGITLKRLSELSGLSTTTLSYKINNIREFKSTEIKLLQRILEMDNETRDAIFFADSVELKST